MLDSCFSGKVLDADDRRPGPWNARGLAQLAYEKGMYILAAAQRTESALELNQLGHGLLTYVLITNGIEKFLADRDPQNGILTVPEWLDYAAEAVSAASGRLGADRQLPLGVARLVGPRRGSALQTARAFYPRDAFEQPWIVARR